MRLAMATAKEARAARRAGQGADADFLCFMADAFIAKARCTERK